MTHAPLLQNLSAPHTVSVGQFESAQSIRPSQSSSWPFEQFSAGMVAVATHAPWQNV